MFLFCFFGLVFSREILHEYSQMKEEEEEKKFKSNQSCHGEVDSPHGHARLADEGQHDKITKKEKEKRERE